MNNLFTKKRLLVFIISLIILSFASCKSFKLSYIGGLKKNAEYKGTLPIPDIQFEYGPATDSNLVLLREKYNLDSVAGNGTEVERIINLMKWVHNLSTHAANPQWPKTMNALNLIDLCLNEKMAINCYMHSIILNEVYLSMGFYSRWIHLWYIYDDESHVVNAVFATSLNKWIMMDSDNQAYCMDENQNILGIPEIRKRLINKEIIHFNKEIDVPSKLLTVLLGGPEKKYRWYLSKNIFMYSMPVVNKFDIMTQKSSTIKLIPTNYIKEVNTKLIKRKYERYYLYFTDNEDFFWQSPLLFITGKN